MSVKLTLNLRNKKISKEMRFGVELKVSNMMVIVLVRIDCLSTTLEALKGIMQLFSTGMVAGKSPTNAPKSCISTVMSI